MDSRLYRPDRAALDAAGEPWNTAFRVQRDVGLNIPLDFHTVPSVSLNAACFAFDQYEPTAFTKCISNLLALELGRFEVDVYWDASRQVWSLCPVEFPPSSLISASPIRSSTPSISPITRRGEDVLYDAMATSQAVRHINPLDDRQQTKGSSLNISASSTSLPLATPASFSSRTSAASVPLASTYPSDGSLVQMGRYSCTSTITLSLLTGIINDFLEATSITTDAQFIFMLLNLHAASSWTNPDDPAQQPSKDRLPAPGNLLSDLIKSNLSSQSYTPQVLAGQRSNLNNGWYSVANENRPAMGYYSVLNGTNGISSTVSGWPTEAYTEFEEFYRIITAFGTVDPQMSGYNIEADEATIFGQGTIANAHNNTVATDGSVTSGCLFTPSEESITESTNSSWAVTMAPPISIGANPDPLAPIASIANLSSCGLSAQLNVTLANVTADQNPLPYAVYARSNLWSWAPGQPLNATSSRNSSTVNKCAVVDPTGPYPGRWRTADCVSSYRVACQSPSSPYHWELSPQPSTYISAGSACPKDLFFAIPRTPLENAHLLSAIRASSASSSVSAASQQPVFMNINALDILNCWVVGIDSTCPYVPRTDTDRVRIVVIPTVAAILIFVLAALTFFVKCAANRREDKRGRRRRMVGGWEYEGVPS